MLSKTHWQSELEHIPYPIDAFALCLFVSEQDDPLKDLEGSGALKAKGAWRVRILRLGAGGRWRILYSDLHGRDTLPGV